MKLARIVSFIMFITLAASSGAVTHTITFAGISYTPQALQASVGDVIRWEGDFLTHPLESVIVPAGAQSFSNSTGTSFEYTITVPGDYGYRCTSHFNLGMVGGFNAAEASVDKSAVEVLLKVQAFPNPASQQLTLSYTLEQSSDVRITLFDMNGRDLYHLEHSATPGQNTTYMNVATLPVGSYYYRIETSDAVLTRKFTISR